LRVAVELDQVEGIEEDIRVMVPVPDAIEGCHPVIATSHSLTIDDAGPRPQVGQRFNNEWEALGQVVARPAVELHPLTFLAGDDPEPVVLDFMQPQTGFFRIA
jgi:hypothetical protein